MAEATYRVWGAAIWLRLAYWLAVAVLALLLLEPVGRLIAQATEWLDYPYPRAGSEGLILYESLLLKHGGDIYAPITAERFISGPYPPVYYWLATWTLPGTLPDLTQPGNVVSLFRPGRIISLVSALVLAALVPLLVIFEGGYVARGRRAVFTVALGGMLGGALLLTLPQVLVWATRFRGDMLALALTVGGLVCVAAGVRDWAELAEGQEPGIGSIQRWSLLAAGAALFAVAFFTKQTAVAGPMAAAAYLLVRDWKLVLRWATLLGLMIAVPFGLLSWATDGWFYLKMVEFHSLPLRELTLNRLLRLAFWEDQWPLIVVASLYTLYRLGQVWLLRGRGGIRSVPLLVPLFTVTALATLPTGAVVGADHNHLLAGGFAICACSGAAIASALYHTETKHSGGLPVIAGPIIIASLAIYAAITSAPSDWYNADLTPLTPQQQEQMRKITLNVRQNPGSLFFADDPGILALAGKETPYDDPFTMTALAQAGRWDEAVYREILREGRFSLLVLSCDVFATPGNCRSDTFTPGVLDAIREGYQVAFRDVYFTYTPK